jgi:hypothetical protein
VGARQRAVVAASTTTSLARLAPGVVSASVAMHLAQVLGNVLQRVSHVRDVATVLALRTTAVLTRFSLALDLMSIIPRLRVMAHVFLELIVTLGGIAVSLAAGRMMLATVMMRLMTLHGQSPQNAL